jgi:hypothetical protein
MKASSIQELKQELRKTGSAYRMMLFNGIHVTISKDSNPDDIATIYDLKRKVEQLELKK